MPSNPTNQPRNLFLFCGQFDKVCVCPKKKTTPPSPPPPPPPPWCHFKIHFEQFGAKKKNIVNILFDMFAKKKVVFLT